MFKQCAGHHKILNGNPRFVEDNENVNMVGLNSFVRDWESISLPDRFNLNSKCPLCRWVVCEKINCLGIAKSDRCLQATFQKLCGNKQLPGKASNLTIGSLWFWLIGFRVHDR